MPKEETMNAMFKQVAVSQFSEPFKILFIDHPTGTENLANAINESDNEDIIFLHLLLLNHIAT